MWRDRMRVASFRGVEFKVETAAKIGGRRGVNHQFPKRDTPSDEDLGRLSGRWSVSGYVIGADYDDQAHRLEDALNAEGPGLLIHPQMGEMSVRCETYSRLERKTEGGQAVFEMTFVEAGTPAADLVGDPTQERLRQESSDAAASLGQNTDTRSRQEAQT